MAGYRVPRDLRLDYCPICLHPHVLRCILKYAIEVQLGADPRWHRWRREL